MNLHRIFTAAFIGLLLTMFCWILLHALWNRISPDYGEESVLAIWRIPQIVEQSVAGFLGGYVAAWIGGGRGGRKLLTATLAAMPFAYLIFSMKTRDEILFTLPAALLDPGVTALFTVASGWIQFRFPLKP